MKLDNPLTLNFSVEGNEIKVSNKPEIEPTPDCSRKVVIENALREKELEITKLKKNIQSLKSELEQAKKKGGDADIDDFLTDLEPFFYKRNLTYVDIGAFVGEVFEKLHNSTKLRIREAHLFEPNPVSFLALKEKIGMINNMPSLHAYNLGLGEKEGKKTFLSAKSMTKAIDMKEIELDGREAFECNITTLDAQKNKFTDGLINLLKVDVEGFEMKVLEGAKSFLEKQEIDVIYIEVGFNRSGTQQTYFCTIDSFLQNYGYRAFGIYEQTKEWISDSPLLRRCNVAYMSKQFSETNSYQSVREIRDLKIELEKLNQKLNKCT